MPTQRAKASMTKEARRLNRDREFGEPTWGVFYYKGRGWIVCETDNNGDPL